MWWLNIHHGLKQNQKLHRFWIVHSPICIYQRNLDLSTKPKQTEPDKSPNIQTWHNKSFFSFLSWLNVGWVGGGGIALLHTVFQQTHCRPRPTPFGPCLWLPARIGMNSSCHQHLTSTHHAPRPHSFPGDPRTPWSPGVVLEELSQP